MPRATLLLSVCALVTAASCKDCFVAVNGSDIGHDGSEALPWASLGYALESVSAGDTVYIRGGRYQEFITKGGVKGAPGNPITIRSYPGEHVVFDGTVPLTKPWARHDGEVYVTNVDQPMWQLFVDGKAMMPARWPNARFDDDSVFTRAVWAQSLEKLDAAGYMVNDDRRHNLSALVANLTGAVVVANVHSFITYTRKVTHHVAGANDFNYTKPRGFWRNHHHFYLEALLELLDQDSEWHIDNDTGKVYLWAPGGGAPRGDIRGRVQQYAVQVTTWQDVVFDGITFFATTMKFAESDRITIQNCQFPYGGASRRALGIAGEPSATLFLKSNGTGDFVIRNVSVTNSDSQALWIGGKGWSTIENCLFDRFDWAASESLRPPAAVPLRTKAYVRRNTISRAGGSETISTFMKLEASYNDISVTGFAQNDGGMIQVMIGGQNGTRVHNNWLHDSPKSGFRFDAPMPAVRWGHNGHVFNNVAWRCGGGMPKGDDHRIYGNTLVNNSHIDLVLLDDGMKGYFTNENSSVVNNAADSISAHRKVYRPIKSHQATNFNGMVDTWTTLDSMLQNIDHYDFRPRTDSTLVNNGTVLTDADYNQTVVGPSPDIGAYELGADEYFIPGRQEWKATFPIPPVGQAISADAPQLMWRPAYLAHEEVVLVGSSPTALRPVLAITGGFNNVYRPGALVNGTYYWRVDSVTTGHHNATGDLWSFTVGTAVSTSSAGSP